MVRPSTWLPIVTVLTAALGVPASAETDEAPGYALVCLVGDVADGCTSTPCPAHEAAALDGGSCASTCLASATISVVGGYTTGSGTVRFAAGCGNQAVATCQVDQSTTWCTDMGSAATGPLWCAYEILSGSPRGVHAVCLT